MTLVTGFSRAEIDIDHGSRPRGESSYTFARRMQMAMGHILAHSSRPLVIAAKLGVLIAGFSVLYGSWLILRYFMWGQRVSGWTSIMVSLYFSTGLIVCTVSLVGIYVGKIYNEVKNRPLYIVDECTENIEIC